MLKFQNNNTTVIATFEDFILTVYVIIDELYHQSLLPKLPPDGISWMQNYQIPKSSQSASAVSWLVLIQKMPGSLL